MKVYCRTIPDTSLHRQRGWVRFLLIAAVIAAAFRLYNLVLACLWFSKNQVTIPLYLYLRMALCVVLITGLIVWLVRPKRRERSLSGQEVATETEFFHEGTGDQYKDHVVLIHSGILYEGTPADVRYLLPIIEHCRLFYEGSTSRLTVACREGRRLIERGGQVITSQKMGKIALTFFVTEEEAAQICSYLDGSIRGLHGDEHAKSFPYHYPVPSEVGASASGTKTWHLQGDAAEWKRGTRTPYREAVENSWRFQTVKVVSRLYIPVAIAAVVLEILLTRHFTNGDRQLKIGIMIVYLAMQVIVLPLILNHCKAGPSTQTFLSTVDITKAGLYGCFYRTAPYLDSDNTDDENLRAMTTRKVLWIPFDQLTGLFYDPSRQNLRFEGTCSICTENAMTDAGKEAPRVDTYEEYTLHDYFRPLLFPSLQEAGLDVQTAKVDLDFSAATRGLFATVDLILACVMGFTVCMVRYWSVFSPVIAIVLMHVIGSIKKKKAVSEI